MIEVVPLLPDSLFGIVSGTVSIGLFSLFLASYYATRPPKQSTASPPLTSAWGSNWLLGFTRPFFDRRHDWFMAAASASPHGMFSFNLGSIPVVGVTGSEARKTFLTDPSLSMQEGYAKLFAAAPKVEEMQGESLANPAAHMAKRLTTLLKPERLKAGFDRMHKLTHQHLLELGDSGTTDPFESMYVLVFHLTMAQVGPREITEGSRENLVKTLKLFETIEKTGQSYLTVLFPWFPTLARAKRTVAGAQLYVMLTGFVQERKLRGGTDDDPLQYLIDQGDDNLHIIQFILGALFAGQLNSGINAGYILLYLGADITLQDRLREEVQSLVDRYATPDEPRHDETELESALSRVPLEAWQTELPLMDATLKEVIRLSMPGTMFRRAMGKDVVVGKSNETISTGTYVAYAVADVHRNPEFYPEPSHFDPDRYLGSAPPSASDYTFLGWGAGKHPCLGMKFAKLETFVLVAYFLARFDFIATSDPEGKHQIHSADDVPSKTNLNGHAAHKPEVRTYLKHTLRK